MNNDTSPGTRGLVARQAGSLSLALWHDGTTPDEHSGYRQRYAYRIVDAAVPGAVSHDVRDIHSGVGADVDTTAEMGTLVSLLSAAAEAYAYALHHPGSAPENLGLFPRWVTEAAYTNSDELAMLAFELEHPNEREAVEAVTALVAPPVAAPDQEPFLGGQPWPPGRYYSVVFVQDEEGHAVVDLLDEHGLEAAIEHLALWDYGSETLEAALFNEYYHAEVPHYPGTRETTSGPYVLSYHPGLGTVHLLREFPTQAPDGWPDRYTGVRRTAGKTPTKQPNQATYERGPAGRQAARPESPRRELDDGLSL
jgi:hypothetical protein